MANEKILIVDDEKELVDMVTFRLQSQEYDVHVAYSGEEALEKVKQESYQLILLDVMMPGIDGFEVLRRLREDPKTRPIPVIMLTCKGEASSIFKTQELGGTDYLIKPFVPQTLLRLIKKYIL